MKTFPINPIRAVVAAATVLTLCAVHADDGVLYKGRPGSSMVVKGTSTIHDWELKSGIIGGTMEVPASFPLDTSVEQIPEVKAVPKVKVTIPVTSLKSYKKRMDEVMREAMDYPKHKMIQFELAKMTPSNDKRKAGDALIFDTEGKLTVSGVTKEIKFPVEIEPGDKTRIMIKGKSIIKMSDFGIDPPAPKIALGLVRTGDEVELEWTWFLAKSEKKD